MTKIELRKQFENETGFKKAFIGIEEHETTQYRHWLEGRAMQPTKGFNEWKSDFCKSIIEWADWRLNQISNPAEAGEFLIDELENLKTLAEANIK